MNYFTTESAALGLKEALKLGACWFVLKEMLHARGRTGLMAYFYWGIVVVSLLVGVSLLVQPTEAARLIVAKMVGMAFYISFVAAIVLLLQSLKPTTPKIYENDRFVGGAIFLFVVIYFSPDVVGSSLYLREQAQMRGEVGGAYISASVAFLGALGLMHHYLGQRNFSLGEWFQAGQYALMLALIKLLGGGTGGFTELSLIPAVQSGVMKFIHDLVHQLFVFFMVPDHPLLRVTVWNFIGILFGSNLALVLALVVLVGPAVAYLYASLVLTEDDTSQAETAAARRLARAQGRTARLKLSATVLIYVIATSAVWFAGRSEQVGALYNPAPKPVVEDKGYVIIPMTDPTMDVMDGEIHKFALTTAGGEVMRLLIVMRPSGKLAVCLDACEVCPPEGYGRKDANVVCIYCRTPIPIETLGETGGCNPIPLDAQISERDIRVSVKEIAEKWARAKEADKTEVRQ